MRTTHLLFTSTALCSLLLSCSGPEQPSTEMSAGAAPDSGTVATPAAPDPDAMAVTAENFCRAETDMYFGMLVKEHGIGVLKHEREAVAVDKQTVVRTNRDTRYSSGVFDLDAGPVTLTLPDPQGRFMSLLAIDQDHYALQVDYAPGTFTFTREQVGTRYLALLIRTFVDPNDPKDVAAVTALQDRIAIAQPGGPGSFEVPKWDAAGQQKVREALATLGETLPEFDRAFGRRDQVDPLRHLIGTARGWGGNPDEAARYIGATPERNDGSVPHVLRVKDVPVDGFWSITVYNEKGFYEAPENAISVNNVTAVKDADGAVSIHFGGDPALPNHLRIMPGWNYTVRLYRPRKEILEGEWTFPKAEPVGS